MIRLFVGFALPHDVRHALLGLAGGINGARWQEVDQMHMTLRFIGEVDHDRLPDISNALASVHAPVCDIKLHGVNIFGKPRAPRTLWVGVDAKAPLEHLHEKINQALRFAGFDEDKHRFVPHVTIARFNKRQRIKKIPEYLAQNSHFRIAPFEVDEFHLFKSHLGHGGARYEKIESFPLYTP